MIDTLLLRAAAPLALAAALATPLSAFAQAVPPSAPLPTPAPAPAPTPAPAPAPQGFEDDFHTTADIIVTAPFARALDTLGKVTVIDGPALVRDLRPQLGDTLARQPGVSSTSFTPGASRPVLRGFQGERVRVLTDGIGALDASGTSTDHAVAIDPLTAERIEILRGPAVLLFGSEAVGGAINVLDRRIPRGLAEAPAHIDALASFGTAADERMIGASIDVPVAPRLALHLDAQRTVADDLRTGGFVFSRALRDDLLADAAIERAEGELDEADELEAVAGLRGRVPNTAVRQWSAGIGASIVVDDSHLGASVGYYDTRYGVPVSPLLGHAHGEEEDAQATRLAAAKDRLFGPGEGEEEAPVSIDLRQWRADLRGDIALGGDGLFERLRVRAGFADYIHTEFEGDEVGTRFFSQGIEARAELTQARRGGWTGASGVQYLVRDFEAVGAEAYVPPNITRRAAVFTLQEYGTGPFVLTGAARYDGARVKATTLGIARSYDALSGAVGIAARLPGGGRASVSLSRTARAPTAEELFSNGPHIATGAFEVGDPTFGKETNWGGEVSVRLGRAERTHLAVAAYANRFDSFIYARATGEEKDDLPVFAYAQAPARNWGIEVEGAAELGRTAGLAWRVDGAADYVRASVRGPDGRYGPVPRIPPLRVRGALAAEGSAIDARVEVEHVTAQDRLAAEETRTAAFTLVGASLGWRPLADARLHLGVQVNNLFDVEARRHASFTKDFVPLAGRDIRLTAKASF